MPSRAWAQLLSNCRHASLAKSWIRGVDLYAFGWALGPPILILAPNEALDLPIFIALGRRPRCRICFSFLAFAPWLGRSLRAIEPSGRMISPEKGQEHSVVPKKGQQKSLSVTVCALPPWIRHVSRRITPDVLGSVPQSFWKIDTVVLDTHLRASSEQIRHLVGRSDYFEAFFGDLGEHLSHTSKRFCIPLKSPFRRKKRPFQCLTFLTRLRFHASRCVPSQCLRI